MSGIRWGGVVFLGITLVLVATTAILTTALGASP